MSDQQFRVGDWVEVRSKGEILDTLDKDGRLDGMPFMPEMLRFCGQRFQVLKSAHKTCDTVFPVRSRRLVRTYHLQTRCDGEAHGGCEAGCLLFWKEAWLRPSPREPRKDNPSSPTASASLSEEDLLQASRVGKDAADLVYVCQATRLPYATTDLSPYNAGVYIQDYLAGNVTVAEWITGILYISYTNIMNLGIGLHAPMRWIYDTFQRLRGGVPHPRRRGEIPAGASTPSGSLGLREGELVRVKSYQDILATCDVDNKNRGLYFDAEMVPYCGRVYRVHKRVTRIIDERTGRMLQMKAPCIILEDVFCRSRYSECRMFCPRQIYSYWREIWLERVAEVATGPTGPTGHHH